MIILGNQIFHLKARTTKEVANTMANMDHVIDHELIPKQTLVNFPDSGLALEESCFNETEEKYPLIDLENDLYNSNFSRTLMKNDVYNSDFSSTPDEK